ncbi:unnamed protein product [Heterobilharzia americana]|nr:unnamed protein product [Heterobilharzia americana]
MYDRRVIRGNTYALHVLPAHAQPDPIEIQKQIERKRNAMARRRMREESVIYFLVRCKLRFFYQVLV